MAFDWLRQFTRLSVTALARRSPIQRAIEAGDKETGVDLMRIEEGLDTAQSSAG